MSNSFGERCAVVGLLAGFALFTGAAFLAGVTFLGL